MKKRLPILNSFKNTNFLYTTVFAIFLMLECSQTGFAQGSVGIGTVEPNASAALDIVSTTKGVLIPRLTLAQRSLVTTTLKEIGLLIYNTDASKFNYWNGTEWEEVGAGLNWFSGKGGPNITFTPNLENAKLGDLYLDEISGDIYQPSVSGFPPPTLSWTRLNFVKNNKKIAVNISSVIEPPISAGQSRTVEFQFPIAKLGDVVTCSPKIDLKDGIIISHVWVSRDGYVSVKFYNIKSNGSDSIAGDYQIAIF